MTLFIPIMYENINKFEPFLEELLPQIYNEKNKINT